jgi:hypothetical protein
MQSIYIPLSDVVNSYLNESEQSTDDNFVRFYVMALEGLRNELLSDFAAPVKTVELTVLANNTAVLPKDYINYSRIGVVNENGEISTLSENQNLTFNKSCSDRRLDQQMDYQTILDNSQYLYWATAAPIGIQYQSLFGIGSQVNLGQFRIDKAGGKIIFDFSFQWRTVVLEYVSVPTMSDNNYWVDEQLQAAVKAYIYWASIRHKRNYSLAEKAQAKKLFYDERFNAVRRMNPINLTQVNEEILKGTFLAPKQ